MKASSSYCGWDIGGAHIKVAQCNESGRLLTVAREVCPLWQGTGRLSEALERAIAYLDLSDSFHWLTMTGEMADCFPNRRQGVADIVRTATATLGRHSRKIGFYSYRSSIPLSGACSNEHWRTVSSVNWHASVRYLASIVHDGIFLDIGSTTTDIIPFLDDAVQVGGIDDTQRMQAGELLYFGVVRTPIMALAQYFDFEGHCYPLVAEAFANTADVYRILEMLPITSDLYPACDGQGKSVRESARRLARMFGYDFPKEHTLAFWRRFAGTIAGHQIALIKKGVEVHYGQLPELRGKTIVGCGDGCFLAKSVAKYLAVPFQEYAAVINSNTALAELLPLAINQSAAAVALASMGTQLPQERWRDV